MFQGCCSPTKLESGPRPTYHADVLVEPIRQALTTPEPTLFGLGGCCLLLAGGFFLSGAGRDRAQFRTTLVLGTMVTSLRPLRSALQSKVRGQVGASFLLAGGLLQLASMLLKMEVPAWWLPVGAVVLAALSVILVILQGKYVENAMRRYLQTHLREFPFSFEDNLGLTREIGELFGVTGAAEDTVERYVKRLRDRLGLKEPPSKLFGRRAPHYPA